MVKSRSFSFSKVMLVLGLLFLYLPMFVLIVYSFNASRLVSVWAGFSTQWYGELFRDEQILFCCIAKVEVEQFHEIVVELFRNCSGACFTAKPIGIPVRMTSQLHLLEARTHRVED